MTMNTGIKIIAKLLLVMLLINVPAASMMADVIENKDKPLRGEYHFPLEKQWETKKAGETLFALVVELAVSDSGNIFLRDMKNKAYYILDKNGKYVGTFGTKGEGPGEVQNTGGASIAQIDDKVMIIDSSKILYFTEKGKFIRSVVNNSSTRPPVLFLNENEFISAPQSITGSPGGTATMKHVNLKTDEVKVLNDFKLFKGGVVERGNMRAVAVIPTITPVMVIGLHRDKLLFGMNDKYKVFIADMNGQVQSGFSLERERTKVTLKQKEEVMKTLIKGLAPTEVAIQVAKMLPETETYYSAIVSHNGMLFLYRSHFYPQNRNQIDIFTPDGKYLYRSFITVDEGDSIAGSPTFHNGFLYMVLMDEEGEIKVAKYKTRFPK